MQHFRPRRQLVRFAALQAVLACGLLTGVAGAEPKSTPTGQLAVDVVTLKSGRTLRGAILQRDADGSLSLVVTRAWYRQAHTADYQQAAETDLAAQREAWTQTRGRIAEWLRQAPDGDRLTFFLKQEQARLEQQLQAPADSEFLQLDLPPHAISKVTPAAPDRQRLAVFAWQEGFTGVETRDAAALRKDLVAKKVRLDGPSPDLSDRLPARPQDVREWAARCAIVEYAYREPLDFQGMGDALVRTGEGQKPDLGKLLPQLFQQQLGSVLDDLLGNGRRPAERPEREWLQPALDVARQAGARGLRVTRLQLNAETLRVSVETRFVAKLADDAWQTVWLATETADGSQARPELEARIEKDPQVRQALEAVQALGLGAGDPVRQAIRVGAATMSAQQAADRRFFEFRDRYAKRLDGPKLPLRTR